MDSSLLRVSGPARRLLQHGFHHRQAVTLSSMGYSTGCRSPGASPWSSPWAAGESLLLEHFTPLVLHWPRCLQSFPPTQSHSSLWLPLHRVFPPLPHCILPQALPLLLMGLAMASSGFILELAGTGSFGHSGKLPAVSHRNHCCNCVLPKPGHTNTTHTPSLT